MADAQHTMVDGEDMTADEFRTNVLEEIRSVRADIEAVGGDAGTVAIAQEGHELEELKSLSDIYIAAVARQCALLEEEAERISQETEQLRKKAAQIQERNAQLCAQTEVYFQFIEAASPATAAAIRAAAEARDHARQS
ncbi:hypothetical protein FA10DRAFT_263378 [Acaromyces ingoldii]|uniref:Uncharacterized protein n=1 Tax=Acaromyces ingoldii TaxID=215250 RepID=A0A316YTQ7_9BASI|nr:hypothetical protein FA10DRAFT_263378 [Acaromyces ingoldii]PWN92601.1 hypothetical protein FA10DRAFT_263378 [Acaromyces ingoldii]